MNSGTRTERTGRGWRLGRGLALAAVLAGLLLGAGAQAQRRGGFGGGMRRVQMARPARMGPGRAARRNRRAENGNGRQNAGRNARNGNSGNGAGARPNAAMRPGVNPGGGYGGRPGQEHLPQWLAQHQNMSPQQQEQMLRREPGFNRLTPDQQQRAMNTLHRLDTRTPEQRERTAARNEMFERLSPEQKQDVRGAAQAMAMMPPGRKALMTRAFNDLRRIPPDERQEILNSARFTQTFSPQERHVLGSLLSIEPYEQ